MPCTGRVQRGEHGIRAGHHNTDHTQGTYSPYHPPEQAQKQLEEHAFTETLWHTHLAWTASLRDCLQRKIVTFLSEPEEPDSLWFVTTG